MKVLPAAALCALFVAPAIARAQAPVDKPEPETAAAPTHDFTMGQLTPTPEMWFYDQSLRNYRDPKTAVRRRAEFEADQRQARLAAQRWFGYSNSRPTANPIPYTGTYSPAWTSNSPYPSQWRGVSRTTVIIPQQSARAVAGYGLW